MYQHNTTIRSIRTRSLRWLSLLAAVTVPLAAQPAHTSDRQLLSITATEQRVDTDGDGSQETVLAGVTLFLDNTASGTIYLGTDRKIEVESGELVWTTTEEMVVLEGTEYRHEFGHWMSIGPVHVEARCKGKKCEGPPVIRDGGGGDFTVWDIVDSVTGEVDSFEASVDWQREYTAGLFILPTQVDADGDGRLDTFSADVLILKDGAAVGTIQLDDDWVLAVESGKSYCLDGQPAATFDVQPNPPSWGIDRIDQRSRDGHTSDMWYTGVGGVDVHFEVHGDMPLAADPCAK